MVSHNKERFPFVNNTFNGSKNQDASKCWRDTQRQDGGFYPDNTIEILSAGYTFPNTTPYITKTGQITVDSEQTPYYLRYRFKYSQDSGYVSKIDVSAP